MHQYTLYFVVSNRYNRMSNLLNWFKEGHTELYHEELEELEETFSNITATCYDEAWNSCYWKIKEKYKNTKYKDYAIECISAYQDGLSRCHWYK